MEYLDGLTLAEVKQRWGNLDWGLKVLCQICLGLGELHKHNLVHRDLKPANLVISEGDKESDFTVKIVDFGISSWNTVQKLDRISMYPEPVASVASVASIPPPKLPPSDPPPADGAVKSPFSMDFAMGESTAPPAPTGHTKSHASSCFSNERAGTPRFMAPEQLQLSKPATPDSDIWALGVIAHRILAKQWPISEEALSDLLTGIAAPEVVSILKFLPDLNPKIAAVIDSCLDLDPQKRPAAQTVAETILEVTGT
jgi:serine/threonine protein kinase